MFIAIVLALASAFLTAWVTAHLRRWLDGTAGDAAEATQVIDLGAEPTQVIQYANEPTQVLRQIDPTLRFEPRRRWRRMHRLARLHPKTVLASIAGVPGVTLGLSLGLLGMSPFRAVVAAALTWAAAAACVGVAPGRDGRHAEDCAHIARSGHVAAVVLGGSAIAVGLDPFSATLSALALAYAIEARARVSAVNVDAAAILLWLLCAAGIFLTVAIGGASGLAVLAAIVTCAAILMRPGDRAFDVSMVIGTLSTAWVLAPALLAAWIIGH